MVSVESFIVRCTAGAILSTLPVGPLNLVLMNLTLEKKVRAWWGMVLGIVAVDATVAIACLALGRWLTRSQNLGAWVATLEGSPWATLVLVLVLSATGLHLILARGDALEKSDPSVPKAPEKSWRLLALAFAMGAAGTVAEPGLALFWSSWWLKFDVVEASINTTIVALIATSVAAGDLLVFGFYRFLAQKLGERLSCKTIRNVQRASGSLLLFGAFVLIVTAFWARLDVL